jgi:hypothetical protein
LSAQQQRTRRRRGCGRQALRVEAQLPRVDLCWQAAIATTSHGFSRLELLLLCQSVRLLRLPELAASNVSLDALRCLLLRRAAQQHRVPLLLSLTGCLLCYNCGLVCVGTGVVLIHPRVV